MSSIFCEYDKNNVISDKNFVIFDIHTVQCEHVIIYEMHKTSSASFFQIKYWLKTIDIPMPYLFIITVKTKINKMCLNDKKKRFWDFSSSKKVLKLSVIVSSFIKCTEIQCEFLLMNIKFFRKEQW